MASSDENQITSETITSNEKIISYEKGTVHHHHHHQQRQKISSVPFKFFEEEVWFSGSELKTDNSSSDENDKNDNENNNNNNNNNKKDNNSEKGAKKKTKLISTNNSRRTSKIKKQITSSAATGTITAAATSSTSSLTKKSIIENYCTKSSITEMKMRKFMNTEEGITDEGSSNEFMKEQITKVISYKDNYEKLDKASASSNISSHNSEMIRWRPKRGSLSLPGLTTELEQVHI